MVLLLVEEAAKLADAAVREELLLRTEAGAAGDSWSECRLLRVPLVDGLEVLVASAAGCAQHRRYAVAASASEGARK